MTDPNSQSGTLVMCEKIRLTAQAVHDGVVPDEALSRVVTSLKRAMDITIELQQVEFELDQSMIVVDK